MKPLEEFVQNHPLATGILGTLSGLFSATAKALHVAAGVLGDLAIVIGFATAVLTLMLLRVNYRGERAAEDFERNDRQSVRRYERGDFHNHGDE